MALHPELLELIRCPKCHGKLTLRGAEQSSAAGGASASGGSLDCGACRLQYSIVDDIPQLLVDEARPIGT